jgi:hypothetical protein
MPYEVTPDIEKRVVVIRMWGDVKPDEVRTLVAQLAADQAIAGFAQLADLRDLTSVAAIGAGDIRAVAAGVLAASPRRAIVAPDTATFGMARMFAALRNMKDTTEQIGVFRTMREAEDWLGFTAV